MRLRIGIALAACLLFALGGCGGASGRPDGPGSEAGPQGERTTAPVAPSEPEGIAFESCVRGATYLGNSYYERGVRVIPRESGQTVTGIVPPCNDTGIVTSDEPETPIELAVIEGVSPKIALLWRGRPDAVLVREGVGRLPRELRLQPPTCDERDEPIDLAGPWYGIWGRGSPDDVDLTAPHKVKLLVDASSVSRYERTFLVVSVPADLERPLTRGDIRWLWEGTIELTVTCRDGGYVAESISAHAPS